MKLAISIVLMLIGAFGIARVQPSLAGTLIRVKQRQDVVLVPPPDKIRALSLKYYSATADLLWVKLLLEYGVHWSERRKFPEVDRYMEAILALEPTHREIYLYADSLRVFIPGGTPTIEDAKAARVYFERGLKALPNDPEVWLRYGQFLAFFGPTYVTDPEVLQEWRVTGARAMLRAVELGADADASLSATRILSRGNEREALIQHLVRAYALASDDATRDAIASRLIHLKHEGDAERMRRAHATFSAYRVERFPYLSDIQLQLLGPIRDPAACAGLARARVGECMGEWSAIMKDRRDQ